MTPDTLLHRQIHPSWVREGRVTSQAFRPTSKDAGLLSVYDGNQISAEDAWRHFATSHPSSGVQSVTVEECHPLPVTPDPAPFPEHAVVDFTGTPRNQRRRISKALAAKARSRGWQYRPRASP